MGDNTLRLLTERYPFISICVYAGTEYVGVIQNRDDSVTTIYDFGSLPSAAERELFLELAATWWWESNHSIPINIFLKKEWEPFRAYLRTFSNRDLEIVHGHICNLGEIGKRRSKKRSITLVRKID